MARRKTKKTHVSMQQNWLIGFVILLLFIGTFVVVTMQDPEHTSVTSSDGLFHLEGTMIGQADVSIAERDDLAPLVLGAYGTVYQVDVSSDGWFPSAKVSYLVGQALIDQVTLYTYDKEWLAWKEVSKLQSSLNTFYLEGEQLGGQTLWVLRSREGDEVSVEAKSVLEELISVGVPNAIAYQAMVAHARYQEEFVVIEDGFDKGGCAGNYQETQNSTITSHETEIEGSIERITVRWYLGEGCKEEEKIESAKVIH